MGGSFIEEGAVPQRTEQLPDRGFFSSSCPQSQHFPIRNQHHGRVLAALKERAKDYTFGPQDNCGRSVLCSLSFTGGNQGTEQLSSFAPGHTTMLITIVST